MTDANVQRESILSAISDVISLVFFISTGFGLIVWMVHLFNNGTENSPRV